jgi:hypothetical protein
MANGRGRVLHKSFAVNDLRQIAFARANGVPKIFFVWHGKLFSDFQDFSLAIQVRSAKMPI